MTEGLTVLIADDEPLARRHARGALESLSWVREVIEAADGISAAALAEARQPAIAILDIDLPGMDGLQVARGLRQKTGVVFATAYDEHAVTAFEIGAVDYVLKPFARARLVKALERARATRLGAAAPRAWEMLRAGSPLVRVFVREGRTIVPLYLRDIERIDAEDDYAALVVGNRRHLIHVTLRQLEERLDPRRFIRIHRSHIVNVDHVQSIEPAADRKLVVVLRSGARILSSRGGNARLRSLLL